LSNKIPFLFSNKIKNCYIERKKNDKYRIAMRRKTDHAQFHMAEHMWETGNTCVTFSNDSPIPHILDIDLESFARASGNHLNLY